VQREAAGVQAAFQPRLGTAQQHDQFQFRTGAAPHGVGEAGELHEQHPFRQREEFLQQPIATEGARAVRQDRFLLDEAGVANGSSRQCFAPRHRPAGRLQHEPAAVRQQLAQQGTADAAGLRQEAGQ
jgi:hypothetical protein